MLIVKDLSFSYDRRMILKNISFELNSQQLIHITGSNGVGKSTLLSTLTGLNSIESGSINYVENHTPDDLAKTMFEYLPAEANGLFGKLSAYKNLHYFLSLRSTVVQKETIINALEKWGLGHKMIFDSLPIEKYSTGMKRRLALARVELSGCPIWILDEPIYGLDKKGCATFADTLSSHLRSGGMGLIVSHETSILSGIVTHSLELPSGKFARVSL